MKIHTMLLPTGKKLRIKAVVAAGLKGEIGQAGDMPWHISEDLQHFKRETGGRCVIMGRRTFESIGRALPNRRNIVISKDRSLAEKFDVEVAGSINDALLLATDREKAQEAFDRYMKRKGEEHYDFAEAEYEECCFIGGAGIFKEAMTMADELVLTVINAEFPDADTFLPELSGDFKEKERMPADRDAAFVSSSKQSGKYRQLAGRSFTLLLKEQSGEKVREEGLQYFYRRLCRQQH